MESKNKSLKVAFLTLGCKVNQYESNAMAQKFLDAGYSVCGIKENPDVIIVNTCTVTNIADRKSRHILRKVKEENKNSIVVAVGCYVQVAKEKVDEIEEIDLSLGNVEKKDIVQIIECYIENKKRVEKIIDVNKEKEFLEMGLNTYTEKTRATIKIQDGCNNFCSYCIVPYVRGRERSRKPKDIINEVKELANQGYKEIMLLGQNVNSYLRSEMSAIEQGKLIDVNEDYKEINSFAKLLKEINKIDGIERIRFISPHPKDFTSDVIEAIAECDKVCKFVHLPLQSGSTRMLKIMNRKYTKEQYLNLVKEMKEKIPNIKFSTDIIVGFAGETEEDFEDTLDVVKKVGFEQVFMFIYSRRVGTPGDKMPNQVPEEIKHKRFDRLKELVESQIAENNKNYVGTIQKVLVEGPSKNNESMLSGRTETNKIVIFEGNKDLINKIVKVKITEDHMWYFKGEKE